MYIYMGHMKYENTKPYEDHFWAKNRIDLVFDYVESVDTAKQNLKLKSGKSIDYDKLIIATGSKPNKFGWPGQDLNGMQGLYSFQDIELMEKNTKGIQKAVVVGGGLIGVEMAEMLHSRNIEVTFLVRESSFWNNVLPNQESNLINQQIRKHGIDLKLETELEEIIGDENGQVKGVKTKSGEEISCEFVGLTVGVSPNIDFLKNSELEIDRGVLVNEFLETNIPNIYAIGDCAQFQNSPAENRKHIEQVWYTGRIHGETLAQTICGNRTAYQPGNWFNSAKFFDLEYQTYGWVFPELKANESDFYWENSSGEKVLHFVFDKEKNTFIGVNAFGLRLRHEIMDQWLSEKKDMHYVLEHLHEANFDPEFYKKYESEIVGQFNRLFGTQLKSKRKRLFGLFS